MKETFTLFNFLNLISVCKVFFCKKKACVRVQWCVRLQVKQLLFLTTVVCQTAGQAFVVSYYAGVSGCRSLNCCFLLQWCVKLQAKQLLFLTSVSGCRSSNCCFLLKWYVRLQDKQLFLSGVSDCRSSSCCLLLQS